MGSVDSTIHRIPTTLTGLPDWDMRLKEARDGHCALRHVYPTAKCFCRKHGSDSSFLITNPSLLAWCFKRATSFTLREDLWLKFVGSGVCVCMFLTTCMCMWLHVFLYGLCAYVCVWVCTCEPAIRREPACFLPPLLKPLHPRAPRGWQPSAERLHCPSQDTPSDVQCVERWGLTYSYVGLHARVAGWLANGSPQGVSIVVLKLPYMYGYPHGTVSRMWWRKRQCSDRPCGLYVCRGWDRPWLGCSNQDWLPPQGHKVLDAVWRDQGFIRCDIKHPSSNLENHLLAVYLPQLSELRQAARPSPGLPWGWRQHVVCWPPSRQSWPWALGPDGPTLPLHWPRSSRRAGCTGARGWRPAFRPRCIQLGSWDPAVLYFPKSLAW